MREVRVECEGGATTASGGGEPAGLDEAEVGEAVQLDGQAGPGQADRLGELGAADGAVVAQPAEQRRLVRVLGSRRHVSHARPLRGPGRRPTSLAVTGP